MKNTKLHLRTSGLADQQAAQRHMISQLRTEVHELNRRITLLQQDNQPNLDLVRHLGSILHSRQSVLHWMQLHSTRQ